MIVLGENSFQTYIIIHRPVCNTNAQFSCHVCGVSYLCALPERERGGMMRDPWNEVSNFVGGLDTIGA